MVYCPNPKCQDRHNAATAEICQSCRSSLLLNGCYRLIQPLVNLDQCGNTEIFEIEDQRYVGQADRCRKVMKILRYNGGDLERLFKQEASHLQTLDHPAIPKVYPEDHTDAGYFSVSVPSSQREVYYFVMEKVEGQNLRDWIQDNPPIDSATLLQWLRELLAILDYLHNHKIWHRDIKPSNIMLQPDGQLVLIDFGAVKQLRHLQADVEMPTRRDLTVTDTCVFAAGYTPPEQIRGKTVLQSDFYALGRTCIHLITQIPPYDLEEDDAGQLSWRQKVFGISSPLAEWIDKLMAPLVCDRPQSAADILAYLESDRILAPPQPPKLGWVYLLNLVLFSMLLISGVFWWQAREDSEESQQSWNNSSSLTVISSPKTGDATSEPFF